MLSAIFACFFGYSLLPGRKPLCLCFAERISGGIMPDGAKDYCKKLTLVWFVLLAVIAVINVAVFFLFSGDSFLMRLLPSFFLCLTVPLTFFIEGMIRRKKFSVAFHTSGSTGKSKTIVKTFEALAREVQYHRDTYKEEWGESERPVFLSTIDPDHLYGVLWRVMLPKALGCECDDEVIRFPEALLEKMRGIKKVFLVTTPSFLERFTAYFSKEDVPQNCIEIITSGGLLTKKVSDMAESVFGLAPRQIFGSTETGGVASRRGDGEWKVFETVRVRNARVANSPCARLAVKSPYSFIRGWYVMGDGVDLSDDGRGFTLYGRMDRLVKINEERIHLPEMEEKIRMCGFEDCALAALPGVRGPVLGAVIVRHAEDVAASRNPSSLELRQMFLPVFPKGTVPKRFRFVHALPRNHQGKILHSEIVKILESSLIEPRMTFVKETENSFCADFVFDKSASYFQGHFPGAPILPGVVQLGLAVRLAQRLIDETKVFSVAKKLKFMHIIEPEKTYSFSLERVGESSFSYLYKTEETICSSGVLLFS